MGPGNQMQARVPVPVGFIQLYTMLCQCTQKFHVAGFCRIVITEFVVGIPAHHPGSDLQKRLGRPVNVPLPGNITRRETFFGQIKQRKVAVSGGFVGIQPLLQQPGNRFRMGILTGDVQQIEISVAFGFCVDVTFLIQRKYRFRIRVFTVG